MHSKGSGGWIFLLENSRKMQALQKKWWILFLVAVVLSVWNTQPVHRLNTALRDALQGGGVRRVASEQRVSLLPLVDKVHEEQDELKQLRERVRQQENLVRDLQISVNSLQDELLAAKGDQTQELLQLVAAQDPFYEGTNEATNKTVSQPAKTQDRDKKASQEEIQQGRDMEAIQNIPGPLVHWSTDLYPRRIWGDPDEDFGHTRQPTNLLAMAVGIKQKSNVDKMMRKFPADNFTILLFHYDQSCYREWKQFNWSARAVHVQVPAQGKWWYAKRFMHPAVLKPYDYIFYWDEDLDLQNFHAVSYLETMKKHKLEIAQPALYPYDNLHYDLTKLVNNSEVHRRTNNLLPEWYPNRTMCENGSTAVPCASFVEVMAPVFTRRAWRCVWHMIQNDLVLGWGLDMGFRACANGQPHENMGIIDSDFVAHTSSFSLGSEESGTKGIRQNQTIRDKVDARNWREYNEFSERWSQAEAEAEAEQKTQP